MSEFACMEDWDLQAVVRGCINLEAPTATLGNPKSCCPPPMIAVEDGALSFTENCETTTVLDELEMIYKPNFSHVLNPVSSQTILESSTSAPKELKEPDQTHSVKSPRRRSVIIRGKSQHKRVVQHVTAAEGFRSDTWAWRKYGQKPIKGLPYPRSYYRCSSSKGCSARKQVERSTLDPGVFIVTYTSEHNHSHPTRRSSVAGSTRRSYLITTPRKKTKSSPHSSKVLPPTTPLMAFIEDEFVQSASLKKEKQQILVQETDQGNYDHGIFNLDDIVLGNELLFPILEEFEELASEPATLSGCILDSLSENFPVPGFFDRSTSANDGHD